MMHTDEGSTQRSEILSRISKMGQPMLPMTPPSSSSTGSGGGGDEPSVGVWCVCVWGGGGGGGGGEWVCVWAGMWVCVCVCVCGRVCGCVGWVCEREERFHSSLVPGTARGEKRAPGVHCSRMCEVSIVTCILLRYTKITTNFSLPADRPHCRSMLLVRNIWKDLKSEIILL